MSYFAHVVIVEANSEEESWEKLSSSIEHSNWPMGMHYYIGHGENTHPPHDGFFDRVPRLQDPDDIDPDYGP